MIAPAHLELLRAAAADRTPHSGRTLLDHLRGTHDLLTAWGNPEPVCLAGLFHSIYGTNAFRHRAFGAADRPRVRAVVGVRAERLAHLFGVVNRPQALIEAWDRGAPVPHLTAAGGAAPVNRADLLALIEIECANLIEQNSGSPALRQIWCRAVDARGLISPGAYAAVKRVLARPRVSVRSAYLPVGASLQ